MAGIAQMLRRWVDPVLPNKGFAKVKYGYAQAEDGSRSIFARLQFRLLSKYPSAPGEPRLSYTSGTVQVITENNIVTTVITR